MTGGLGAAIRELRRAAQWHRRLLAAGLAAAAVAFALSALKPPPPAQVSVVVAARDLPGGTTLTGLDVAHRLWPTNAVPESALTITGSAVGRLLASAIRAGEPLTDVRLLGPALLGSLRSGQVAAPVRVADPTAVTLLHAGDLIDVLAANPGDSVASGARAAVVAAAVRVIAVPVPRDTASASEGALVVLAVDDATALDLARASVNARLSVLLRPG